MTRKSKVVDIPSSAAENSPLVDIKNEPGLEAELAESLLTAEPSETEASAGQPEPQESIEPLVPDMLESESPAEPPGETQPESESPAPILPEVQLVFDSSAAEKWLRSSWLRLTNVYLSLRFEPEGIDPKQAAFCLYLAVRALKPNGVIYVPKDLADSPHLEDLIPGEPVGDYAVFIRP